jgi:hypothetical protein
MMGHILYKVGDDQYIEFSTETDSPCSDVMSREEMVDHLIEEYYAWHRRQAEYEIERIGDRLDFVDEHYSSSRIPGTSLNSAEEAVEDIVETYNMNRQSNPITKADFWETYGRA